jgi:RND family efflux transporter MFP subunit
MKRAVQRLVGVAVVLLIAASTVYLVRSRRVQIPATPPPPTADRGSPTPTAAAATPARGEVTIDPRRQQLIGVRTVPVERRSVAAPLRTTGVIRYDETRQADVNVKVEGWIRELYVDATGQTVRAGQPMFTLYSPDLLNTQHEYLLALTTRDQMQQSVIPEARDRAEALVTSARQRLALWDLPAEEIRALDTKRQASDAVVFRSPASGIVTDKQALKGQHVMPGQTLYKLADLTRVWVEADIYENEIADIRAGTPATITVAAYPGERFEGRAIYIYPYLDEKTRTNKVRFEFANRNGRLKPGMFADVELKRRGGTGLLVPTNALLDSGMDQIVFVAQGEGMFEPRTVKVGRRLPDAIEILDGVKEGEQVATGATFFLDSESQLRASLQGYAPSPSTASALSQSAGGGADAAAARLDIALRTTPDPPKGGDENQFEAVVKDASGKPIDEAEVSVQLFMPAMPTMNMPAMQNQVKLSTAGGGVYRGTGQILMAGRWDATVTVTRGAQRLGSKRLPLVAR